MLQREHSAILSTFIKLPFVIKIFILYIFEWLFRTGFTVAVIVHLKNALTYVLSKKLHELAHLSECILTSYNMRGVSGGKPARLFKSGKSSAETKLHTRMGESSKIPKSSPLEIQN